MIKREKKVFAAADLNDDKKLTKDELADFLHPGQCLLSVSCVFFVWSG